MKKLLAVLLALLTVLSITACGNGAETDVETDPETVVTPGTESETDAATESETEPTTETEPETETDPIVPPVDNTFVDRDETVYVNGANALNVRSANNTEDSTNIVGSLKEGDSVKRVGYNEVWSKIEYNGAVCYASSKYLSTKAPVAFTDVDEVVYVKVENTVMLRSKPWAESEALAYLANGIMLARTGIAADTDEFGSAWSRVKYINEKGDTIEGYINSKFLSTEAPIAFTEVNETVVITNCESLNLRAEASLAGKSLASPAKGTEIQRIGIAVKADEDDIVWSMLMYEGNVCYASSNYLATVETPKTFSVEGMNLTLSDDFTALGDDVAEAMGFTAMLDSDPIGVGIIKESFDSLTAANLSTAMSPKDYGEILIKILSVESSVVVENDQTYFLYEYELPAENGATAKVSTLTFLYKSENAFWQLQFQCFSNEYIAHKANLFEYANSVTFD